jgi:hypothetical protein
MCGSRLNLANSNEARSTNQSWGVNMLSSSKTIMVGVLAGVLSLMLAVVLALTVAVAQQSQKPKQEPAAPQHPKPPPKEPPKPKPTPEQTTGPQPNIARGGTGMTTRGFEVKPDGSNRVIPLQLGITLLLLPASPTARGLGLPPQAGKAPAVRVSATRQFVDFFHLRCGEIWTDTTGLPRGMSCSWLPPRAPLPRRPRACPVEVHAA